MQQDAIQREMQKTEILQLGANMILYPKLHRDRGGMKYANTYLFANCFTFDQW